MEAAVREIGATLKRPYSEIEATLDKLRRHWIDSLADWRRLSVENRKAVGLPLLLQHHVDELALNAPALVGEPCLLNRLGSSVLVAFAGQLYELPLDDSLLETFLEKLDPGQGVCALLGPNSKKIDSKTPLVLALIPGSRIAIGDSVHPIEAAFQPTVIDRWLVRIGMEKYSHLFYLHHIDDYFTIPFLRGDILETMGIANSEDRRKIMDAVRETRASSPTKLVAQWVLLLGFEQHATTFLEEQIDLQSLLLLREADLVQMFGDSKQAAELFEEIDQYARFSSVEETFLWLRANGFEKYSFHFARYNIPFYALPFVNFFIINEIGVTSEDQKLLAAMQQLKDSPAYNVKAVAYWLRDLEMEKYNLVFANNLLFTLETLTVLNDGDIDRLVSKAADREKMCLGIREMKEFQFYYSATASLLQELGMDRYSELFAHHGISIDILPLLSDVQLKEMGVTSSVDREKIMMVIRKLKSSLPDDDSWPFPKDYDRVNVANPRRNAVSSSSKRLKPMKESPSKESGSNRLSSSDIRSVEEWLAFINDDSRPVVLKESPATLQAVSSSKSPSRKASKKKKRRAARAGNLAVDAGNPEENGENPAFDRLSSCPTDYRKDDLRIKSALSISRADCGPSSSIDSCPAIEGIIEVSASLEGKLGCFADSAPFDFDSLEGEFDDLDDMDPELKAMLDKEVEEFRLRLESVSSNSKSKLTPLFYLPD